MMCFFVRVTVATSENAEPTQLTICVSYCVYRPSKETRDTQTKINAPAHYPW